MSSVIRFPLTPSDQPSATLGRRHFGADLFADVRPQSHHAVQFYEDERFLLDTVGQFLASGLEGGDTVVVIATEPRRDGLKRRLEAMRVEQTVHDGRLRLLDASETLSRFMVGPMPDADLFRDWIARLVGEVRAGGPRDMQIRAFGEMVDVLWREGNSRAAIRLEELWNDAQREHSFSLLCAYVMGNFYKEGDQTRFFDVCRNHSHVLPTERFSELDDPNARLREISLLQQRALALENEIRHRNDLEKALRDALAERSRAEEDLRASVEREREARAQAEMSDAFKEMFLGILGHDLRNPLNTILTTTRLMTMRRELPPESQKRLERVVISGERMQRMIEQILDLTGARLGGGIDVQKRMQDLGALALKVVDEFRVASPAFSIEFCTDGPCIASVDGDRFEQVVSNLLGNAVKHGDTQMPIRVALTASDTTVRFAVHNYGTPIEPAFMPLLFDPFKRGHKPRGRPDGLGLGLYISERIVYAHGGKIEVESSLATGTRFEAIFPKHE